MSGLREIRLALAEVYSTLGYRTYDTLREQMEIPFAAVSWPDRVRYGSTLTGGFEVDIVVSVGVSLNDFDAAQVELDGVLAPSGIPDQVPKFVTDAWYDCVVSEATNIRQVNVGALALVVDFVHEISAEA